MAGVDIPRCEVCGHADSRHNDCRYCQVSRPLSADKPWFRLYCPCDGGEHWWDGWPEAPVVASSRDAATQDAATP